MRKGLLLVAIIITAAALGAAGWAATTKTLHLGDIFRVTGRAGTVNGSRAIGLVVVRGRWAKGTWRVVTIAHTDAAGRYRFGIKPHRQGVLTLRITPPDKRDVRYVLRIV